MKYKKQIQLIAAIVTLIVFPVITFYLMEAYTHNPFEEVRPWAQFFNILLFELLAWIFVSVTGKIQSGLRIELVTAMIYGIANAYVVRFRTNPIVPWDIFSWKTAASVASNYDFTGKKIHPFCTHEGSGLSNTESDIKGIVWK